MWYQVWGVEKDDVRKKLLLEFPDCKQTALDEMKRLENQGDTELEIKEVNS